MNLRQLQCFQLIAEYLNFSKAADELYITQSAASQQIHALEEELGTKLFDRGNKKVVLTEAGQFFYDKSKDPLEKLVKTVSEMHRFCVPQNRTVSIGCYAVTRERFVSELLGKLIQRNPTIAPAILRKHPHELLDALYSGEVDAALLSPEDVSLDMERVHFFPLHEISLVCILPKTHPLAAKENLCKEDLRGSIVVVPAEQNYPWKTFQYIRTLILSEIEGIQVVESKDGAVTDIMLASYPAVTVRPDYAAVDDETLLSIPLQCNYRMDYGVAIMKSNKYIDDLFSGFL